MPFHPFQINKRFDTVSHFRLNLLLDEDGKDDSHTGQHYVDILKIVELSKVPEVPSSNEKLDQKYHQTLRNTVIDKLRRQGPGQICRDGEIVNI